MLAALDQRITVRYTIDRHEQPPTPPTTSAITANRRTIRHPVLRRRDRADPRRLAAVTPARVNKLALHALIAAFAADHAIVDEKAARIAIAETAAD